MLTKIRKSILKKAVIVCLVAIITVCLVVPCGITASAVTFPDEYEDFLTRMGNRESHNNYGANNNNTYFGRWQTTTGAIKACGLMDSSGNWTALANSYGVYSMNDYLSCPLAQYYNVYTFHRNIWNSLVKLGADKYLGTYIRGVYVNISGLVGLSHEYGYGNTIQFLKEEGDGWNTALTVFDYYNDFDITATITGPAISFSPDPEPPTIESVDFEDISGQSFTVVVNAEDNKGISKVYVAVWSTNDGQDDIKWHELSESDNEYRVTIYTKDHGGQTGDYCVYVGVYDLIDNLTECSLDISLPDFYCTTSVDVMPNDAQRVNDNFLVAGWCFCKASPETKFYLSIDKNSEQISKISRSDVKNAYSLSFDDVGFSTYVDISKLSPGNHTIKLYVENEFGIPFVITERSFTVIRATEQKTLEDKYTKYVFYKSNYNMAEAQELCVAQGGRLCVIDEDNAEQLKQNADGTYFGSDTAINQNGLTDSTDYDGFILQINKASLEVSQEEITVKIGETKDIEYTVFPDDTPKFINSDDAVCNVGEDGKITALSKGESTVTVKIGAIKKTVKVICVEFYHSETGDCNGDGEVNAKDLVRLKKYLAGQKVEIFSGADLNGNEKIESVDLVRMKKRLAGAG